MLSVRNRLERPSCALRPLRGLAVAALAPQTSVHAQRRPYAAAAAPPPAAFVEAPARRTPPRLARPAAFGPNFAAAPVRAPTFEDGVTPKYRGLSVLQLEEAFRAEHPRLLEALAGCAHEMTPASSARLLRHLEAELPPALTDMAASGDCVLVAVAPGLLPLLARAAECAEASLVQRDPAQAAATAVAALSILSSLAFAGAPSAAPYARVATRCKLALKAAYDTGADVRQEDVVEMYACCSRSSPWLWLTPYFGHRCASAVDDFITQGWANGELAVRFAEAYALLVQRGRYGQTEGKWVRLARAAMRHPLSLAQTGRLLAAAARLPVEMSIQLSLHARSHPTANWQDQLLCMHRLREQEAQQAAALQARALDWCGAKGEKCADGGVLTCALAPARIARTASCS